jgi:hypothetical protein
VLVREFVTEDRHTCKIERMTEAQLRSECKWLAICITVLLVMIGAMYGIFELDTYLWVRRYDTARPLVFVGGIVMAGTLAVGAIWESLKSLFFILHILAAMWM